MTLFGERFEYETSMLIEAIRSKTPIHEEIIKTVYINDNKETHFRPVADSIAIYRLIFSTFFKYIAVALSSFAIDYGLFCLLSVLLSSFPLSRRIWISTVMARVVSSLYNYSMNHSAVFRCTAPYQSTLFKYYALCIVQMLCSASCVSLLCTLLAIPETISKLLVDTLLFLISFQIQKNWIFKEGMK